MQLPDNMWSVIAARSDSTVDLSGTCMQCNAAMDRRIGFQWLSKELKKSAIDAEVLTRALAALIVSACFRIAARSLKRSVRTPDTDMFKAAARWDKFSVDICLWSASRKMFKTALNISAAQLKSWDSARHAVQSGLGDDTAST